MMLLLISKQSTLPATASVNFDFDLPAMALLTALYCIVFVWSPLPNKVMVISALNKFVKMKFSLWMTRDGMGWDCILYIVPQTIQQK